MKGLTAAAVIRVFAFMLTAALAAMPPLIVRAEVAAADPIDASMRTCLARADMSSASGQLQCMDTARLAWQASIDQSFRQLLTKGPAAQNDFQVAGCRKYRVDDRA